MSPHQQKHIAKIIERELGWTNGWQISDASYTKQCIIAAQKIAKYLKTSKRQARPR